MKNLFYVANIFYKKKNDDLRTICLLNEIRINA